MTAELQLISDGDGVVLLGDEPEIERFLAAEGLVSVSQEIDVQRLGRTLGRLSGVAQAGSEVAASSGRWVKLTDSSARALKHGTLMQGSEVGAARAVLMKNGKISSLLEIAKTPTSFLTNPAVLTGAAGILAQLAMQQSMEEITAYLRSIDEKVDDILRAHTDAVLADMVGVGMNIDEAMSIREEVGRVSNTTWSKVQNSSATLARSQAYALQQLEGIAEKLEERHSVADLARIAEESGPKVQEWLRVIARCFQLYDALGVLELEHVMDADVDELEAHRRGLQLAKHRRVEAISAATTRLIDRINAASGVANTKVLFRPVSSGRIVRSGQAAVHSIREFQTHLGIESGDETVDARRWGDAVSEVRDKVLVTTAESFDTVKRTGGAVFDQARDTTGRLSEELTQRFPWSRNESENESDDEGPESTKK